MAELDWVFLFLLFLLTDLLAELDWLFLFIDIRAESD